jgi:hypothetical protein
MLIDTSRCGQVLFVVRRKDATATTDRFEVALTGGGENEKGTAEAVPMDLLILQTKLILLSFKYHYHAQSIFRY